MADNEQDNVLEPGGHKVFTIDNQIHSFGARFQGASDFGRDPRDTFDMRFTGEPGNLPMISERFDPTNMPPWWVRVIGTAKFPGETPSANRIPSNLEDTIPKEIPFEQVPGRFTPVSMKETPGGPKMPDVGDTASGPFRGGGASGKPVEAPNYSELKEAVKSGRTLRDIAEDYNVSHGTVKNWVDRYGISSNPSGRKSMATDKELFERLDRGEKQIDIAKELGVSPSALSTRLKNAGLTKLSAQDMRELREFYKKK